MIHVKGEDTATPQVNWEAKTADCICTNCNTSRDAFPLGLLAKFSGNFTVSPIGFCECNYVTVYTANGPEPIIAILSALLGLTTFSPPGS